MEFNTNIQYIEKLIEKYLEAGTSVAEEQELQAYFNQEHVAPHLMEYAVMFRYFSNAKEEHYAPAVPLTPVKKRKNYFRWISAAAVAVVLALGTYVGVEYQKEREAELAYQQTKEAFQLLAQNLHKSKEHLIYLNEFEETKEKILNIND